MTPAQLRAAVGAGLAALVLATPLAWVAYDRAADRARFDTAQWADGQLDDALLFFRLDDREPPANTWQVNLADEWSFPLGDTWTEPPLLSLAEPGLGGEAARAYEFDGRWYAASRWIGNDDVLLTVVTRDPEEEAISAARLRWTLVALTMAAGAAGAGWWLASRGRGPVEEAHAVNRDFIADAAHELRTPLSIIQASAGHALARERTAEEYRESLEEILVATERAGSSVGELLEFARLEAGQASPRLAPLRLDLLVEEVAASVRVDDVVIEAAPSEAVVVEADYNLIRQVVDNITRNAAARADKVTLTTHLEQTEARIEIADDGPGFDPGVIEHVFERFRRGDQAGAVGLGMAIARRIVELHGGRCQAANRADGGAFVTVHLPYKPTRQPG